MIKRGKKLFNLKSINTLIEYSVLAVVFVIVFFTDYNYFPILPVIPMFLFIQFVHWYDRRYKLNIPDHYFTFGMFFAYMNICGDFFFELYYNMLYYDKLLHLVIPAYLAVVINFFLRKTVRFREVFVIFIVMGIASLWEMVEYFVDSISGTTIMQGVVINMKEMTGGFADTMKDMFWAMIGGIVGTLLSKIDFKEPLS